MADSPAGADARPRLGLYICTYRRNDALRRCIRSVQAAAEAARDRVAVGVIVVDDNTDGRAAPIAEEFDDTFELGCRYRHSGQQNISIARNLGIDAALEFADWVGMIDDDEVVNTEWAAEMFRIQGDTDADAVTGPLQIDYPDDAPRWLHTPEISEFFGTQLQPDGSATDTCYTSNSMIRAQWLRDHPDHRFPTDLGEVGGEDMVFYRSAIAAGLRSRYAAGAVAREPSPPERNTWSYVARRAYWMGNTTAVTNLTTGEASRGRLVLRGAKKLLLVPVDMVRDLISRSPKPAWRAVEGLVAVGILTGAAGIRAKHG